MKKLVVGVAVVWGVCVSSSAEPLTLDESRAAMIDSSAHDFELDFGDEEPQSPPIHEVASRDPFAEGTWVWNIYGEVGFGSNVGESYSAHFGAGYNVVEGLNLSFNGGFIYADMERDESKDAFGGQVDVTLRWHFLRRETWSLFGDFTAGIAVFSREFPRFGSQFNFIWQLGLGATYKLSEEVWLQGGIRWTHISNGHVFDDRGNPGYDGLSMWIGVMMPF